MTSTDDAYRMTTANLQRSMRSSWAQVAAACKAAFIKGEIGSATSMKGFVSDIRRRADTLEAFAKVGLATAQAVMTKAVKRGIDSASNVAEKPSGRRGPDVFKFEAAQLAQGPRTDVLRQSNGKRALLLDPDLAAAAFKDRAALANVLVRLADRLVATRFPPNGQHSLLTVGTSQVVMSPELALSIQGFRTR